MIVPIQTFRVACRLLLLAAALIATGCQSARPVIRVTSPPAPRVGSMPIAAYDEYALSFQRQAETKRLETLLAVALR